MTMTVVSDKELRVINLAKSIKEVLEELSKMSNPQVVEYLKEEEEDKCKDKHQI